MSESIASGIVLGFGGTNARFGVAASGDIQTFNSISTPEKPQEFFDWMSRKVLQAADDGHEWLVAGFPGPVSPDGTLVGPMANVPGLSKDRYNLEEELASADQAVGRLITDGFNLVAVNDGELAAQAAATHIGQRRFNSTAALIVGTGVGAGVVIRDKNFTNIYRADRKNPNELGHILLSADPTDTFENSVSGPALERDYGMNPANMPKGHPAWERVGGTVGRMATLLGVMNGVELVVPCGGVGSGGTEKYQQHLNKMLADYRANGNGTQKLFLPEILSVPHKEAQVFELFGGEGVIRDFMTRAA